MFSFKWWGGNLLLLALGLLTASADADPVTILLADGSVVFTDPDHRDPRLFTLTISTNHLVRLRDLPGASDPQIFEETVQRSFSTKVRIVALGENEMNRGNAFHLGVRPIPVSRGAVSLPLIVDIGGEQHVVILNPVEPAQFVLWIPLFPDLERQRAFVRKARQGTWTDAKIPGREISGWNGLRRLDSATVAQLVYAKLELKRRRPGPSLTVAEFNALSPLATLQLSYTSPDTLMKLFGDAGHTDVLAFSVVNLQTLITACDDPRLRREALRMLSLQKAYEHLTEDTFWRILEPLLTTSSTDFKVQLAETCLIEDVRRPHVRRLFREMILAGDRAFFVANGSSAALRPLLVQRLLEAVVVNRVEDPETVALLRALFAARDVDILKVRNDFVMGATQLGRRIARWIHELQASLDCHDSLVAMSYGLVPPPILVVNAKEGSDGEARSVDDGRQR